MRAAVRARRRLRATFRSGRAVGHRQVRLQAFFRSSAARLHRRSAGARRRHSSGTAIPP